MGVGGGIKGSEVCNGARKVGVPAKSSTKYQHVASQPMEKTSPRINVDVELE